MYIVGHWSSDNWHRFSNPMTFDLILLLSLPFYLFFFISLPLSYLIWWRIGMNWMYTSAYWFLENQLRSTFDLILLLSLFVFYLMKNGNLSWMSRMRLVNRYQPFQQLMSWNWAFDLFKTALLDLWMIITFVMIK